MLVILSWSVRWFALGLVSVNFGFINKPIAPPLDAVHLALP